METKQEKYSLPPNGKAVFPLTPVPGKKGRFILDESPSGGLDWVVPRFPLDEGEATKLKAEAAVRAGVWHAIEERWAKMQAQCRANGGGEDPFEVFPYETRRKANKAINPAAQELRIQLELKKQMELKDKIRDDLEEFFKYKVVVE